MSAPFRITHGTMRSRTLDGLQQNLSRMQRLQEQLSSGKQIRRPSDAPADTAASLKYRSDIKRLDQFGRNAQDGIGWLGTADDALTRSLDMLGRVRELVLRGANASSGPQDRLAMAAEVDTLRQGVLGLANAKYQDRAVFAGTAGTVSAYAADGTYLGDAGSVGRTVAPGVSVEVNVTGPTAFGAGPSSVFAVLETIADRLRSGTAPDIASLVSTDLGSLDAARVVVQNNLAEVGARYHRVEMMQNRATDAILGLQGALSEIEDIDLPRTIVDLQLQEVSYKAALSATARVIQPSLVEFLR